MCRYFSGMFQHHPLLEGFDWYWRLEPKVTSGRGLPSLTLTPPTPNPNPTQPHPTRTRTCHAHVQVQFFCNMNYDPFVYMRDRGLVYGWTIIAQEDMRTIRSLWPTTQAYLRERGRERVLAPGHSMGGVITGWGGPEGVEDYSGCHFWSNFEIGRLDFFRSTAYMDYFNYLDRTGNFFYER
jgi:alpha 1,2-mannosyltransferase